MKTIHNGIMTVDQVDFLAGINNCRTNQLNKRDVYELLASHRVQAARIQELEKERNSLREQRDNLEGRLGLLGGPEND